MNEVYEKLMKCFETVEKKISFKPELALILGSGLGDFCDTLDIKETLDYNEIPGFPISTVVGHKGRFVFGFCGEVPIVAMQGRVHYYEGYSVAEVGDLLGLKISTVQTRLARGRAKLKAQLEEG